MKGVTVVENEHVRSAWLHLFCSVFLCARENAERLSAEKCQLIKEKKLIYAGIMHKCDKQPSSIHLSSFSLLKLIKQYTRGYPVVLDYQHGCDTHNKISSAVIMKCEHSWHATLPVKLIDQN